MTTTIREQIISALVLKLGEILTDDGYRTDCGANVQRAVYKHAPDDPPMIVIFPRPEEVERKYGESRCTFDFDVELISSFAQTDDPVTVSESMLADVIECLTGETCGGLVDDVIYTRGGTDRYPDPGESVIGTQATFIIKYKTVAGDPYSQ